MSVASYVTLFRILTIFPIIYFVYFDSILFKLISLLLFTLGALSDYLDGYIARKTDTTSEFGAKFDLVTDKLFVCIILIFIISLRPDLLLIIPSLIIISREFSEYLSSVFCHTRGGRVGSINELYVHSLYSLNKVKTNT